MYSVSVSLLTESSFSGVMGSPKKKGLFKKPSSRPAAPSGGGFPVALSFSDDGMSTCFVFPASIFMLHLTSSYLRCH